ncbi:MAG: aminotransferase class I/II-fold pyridoxal phosphate-dependent enzyme [Planctomycetota bacterium]|nr:aminotransferase class I/II-fold pyridoxal phosphate-dependent enzyme [Planctomycetota bacterium]
MSKNIDLTLKLFEVQERFDRLYDSTLKRFGNKFLDLSYANAYDGPTPVVLEAMEKALRDKRDLSFQYTPYGGSTLTRRRIATALRAQFDLEFHFRDIVLTPGAMAALNMAFRTLVTDARHEIIVLTPCWLDYPLYLSNLDIRAVYVPLSSSKHLDLEKISKAINTNTRAIVFSHPGCPTGVVFSTEELNELSIILDEAEQRHSSAIYLISDESHRDVWWRREPFHSPMMSYDRCLSIYSFGKALFLQGQRIGYVCVSPRMKENNELRVQLVRNARAMGFCTPTNLMQRAVCDLLDYEFPGDVVAGRQKLVRDRLSEYGYEVCSAQATFFVYVKSPIPDEFAFVELLAEQGVVVLPSSLFHESGYFRISVTARTPDIEEHLSKFKTVLHLEQLKGAAVTA